MNVLDYVFDDSAFHDDDQCWVDYWVSGDVLTVKYQNAAEEESVYKYRLIPMEENGG